MTGLTIGVGTQVTLHFAVKLPNGDVVDSTFDGDAATFAVGDGNLLEGFELALFGLLAGDRQSFTIPPDKGFGQPNPSNVQDFSRDQFDDDVELQPGLMLAFSDAQNDELPGVVVNCDQDTVTVDFNHPLAGKDVVFEVEIIEVNPIAQH